MALAITVHVGCGGGRVRCYNLEDPTHVEAINARLDEHKAKIRLHSGEVHTVKSACLVGGQCTWPVKPKWWLADNDEPDTVAVPVSSIKSIAWKDHGRGARLGALFGAWWIAFGAFMDLGTSDEWRGLGTAIGVAFFPLYVATGWIAGVWTDYAIDESCQSWAGDEPSD